MSIAEFYMENGIDPGDPDSFDAYLDGASEGNHDGAWAYAGMREAEGIVVVDAPIGSDFDRSGQWDAVLAGAARVAGPPAGLNATPAIASRAAAGAGAAQKESSSVDDADNGCMTCGRTDETGGCPTCYPYQSPNQSVPTAKVEAATPKTTGGIWGAPAAIDKMTRSCKGCCAEVGKEVAKCPACGESNPDPSAQAAVEAAKPSYAPAAPPPDIHPGAVAPTWVIEATATDVTSANKTAATYFERLHAAVHGRFLVMDPRADGTPQRGNR